MRLTFGDMTKEVNVFHLRKQPRDFEDQTFEVNLIEGLTSKHKKELEYKPECEFKLESYDFNLNQIVDSTVKWATTPILLSQEPKDLSSTEQFLSFEFKALSSHLKYVYLGEKEALPVIIYSNLTEKQDILVMLRQQRIHCLDHG